jgi:hypothetical protein
MLGTPFVQILDWAYTQCSFSDICCMEFIHVRHAEECKPMIDSGLPQSWLMAILFPVYRLSELILLTRTME